MSFVEEVGGKRSVVEWGRMSTENWKENNGISREKIEDSEARVVEFLDRILEEDENILIVAHELIITVLYRELLERICRRICPRSRKWKALFIRKVGVVS